MKRVTYGIVVLTRQPPRAKGGHASSPPSPELTSRPIDTARPFGREVRSAPGMTETSLVPLSVEAAGMELGQLFQTLCIAAVRRSSFIDK